MTSTPTLRMGAQEWLLMLALSVLWGASFLFIRMAVAEIAPIPLVLARVVLAAAILWAVVLLRGLDLPRTPASWAAFAGMGILNNVIPFSLLFWAQQHLTTGLAAVLNATTPLWTVLLAHWLTSDERMLPRKVVGVLIGLAGVGVMIGPAATQDLGAAFWAELAVIGAALSYGFAGIFGRRFKGSPPLMTATGQLTMSSLMLALPVLVMAPPWAMPMPSPTAVMAVVALAALSTALAYIMYFRILAKAGASNASLVTQLVPVSAMLLGAIVLAEPVTTRQLLGMAAIAVGLAVIDGRALAWLRGRAG